MIKRLIEEVEYVKPEFLWHPYIPFGFASILQGKFDKMSIVCCIAAGLSHGIYPPRLRDINALAHSKTSEWKKYVAMWKNNKPENNAKYRVINRGLLAIL